MTPLLRFAPSPTGALHLGGLRTALYNHLYAKKWGGKWILRIEDTDAARYVPGAVENIRGALAWAGLEYDYGPGKGGPHGPYFQSERLDLYHTYAKKLLDSGHAYRCFCSADRLQEAREKLARSGSVSTYDKACLHLTEEEVARRVRAGEKSIIRLNDGNLPNRPELTKDVVFGNLKDAHLSLPTDPVLLKSDLFPTYHLANVADDHEMGITHVLRGEEWLTSLPLHLDLYSCLGLEPPQYAHLPILINADGTKMSKRNGDVQVGDFISRGWEPEAITNWLALAGWGVQYEKPDSTLPPGASPKIIQEAPDSTKIYTMPELIDKFDLSALTHRRTSLDPQKLEYLNKHHLMRTWSTEQGRADLAKRVQEHIQIEFPDSPYTTIEYIQQVIQVLEARLTNIRDIPLHGPYFFDEPDFEMEEAQKMIKGVTDAQREAVFAAVKSRLSQVPEEQWATFEFSDVLLHEIKPGMGNAPKAFMTILRHALSAMKNGPPVADIIRTLGKERTLKRLQISATSSP